MKFLNFSIVLMDGSNKRITTEYKAEENEIFKEIIEKIFQKHNIPLNFENLIIKDVESMNIDPTFWNQKISEITQLYGILFVIEVYPHAAKQVSQESDEEIVDQEVSQDQSRIVEGPPSAISGGAAIPRGAAAAPAPSIMTKSKEMEGPIRESKKARDSFSKELSKLELDVSHDEQRKKEAQEYDKNIAVEYYDRMNPEQNYILKLNISDLKIADVGTRENLLTGERITQKKAKLKVLLEDPNVLIRPLFPGCLVVPSEQWTNFDSVEDELIFHVTPLVKGEIMGAIDFISKNKIAYRMPLPAKVDDPRYAKTVVAYGTGISLLPKILPWFGIDVGESLELADIMPFLGGLMGSIKINNFIAIVGILIFIIAGIVIFMKKQAKFTKIQFNLNDIANYQKTNKRDSPLVK